MISNEDVNNNISPSTLEAFNRFNAILRQLRMQCPWDSKQTWESLRPLTVEEVYELAQALEDNNAPEVKKELGDVFLHVAFYSLIAEEKSLFNFADVLNSLCDKLVRRHPHVFGYVEANNEEDVSRNWEQIKLREKDGNKSVLSGVPRALPALIKAYRIQGKARGVGFDWKNPAEAWDKVNEEAAEFRAEVQNQDRDNMEKEMGDLLFSVVNLARLYGINPENALEKTNRKFIARFEHIEQGAAAQGKKIDELTIEQMEALWQEAKHLGANQ